MSSANTATKQRPPTDRMHCMEVWGGNQRTHRHLSTAGLETWVYSQPQGRDVGGGDVYYVSSCASGRITRLLLADVSGHGHEAAAVAVTLRDLMRRNVNFIRPTRLVRAMNRQFAQLAEAGRFATSLVCSYFAPKRTLSICNAGHPQPLLYRSQTGNWSLVEHDATPGDRITDLPLGVIEHSSYSQVELRLEDGDMLLLFSDGVIESPDERGRQLGSEGALELVRSMDVARYDELIASLRIALHARSESDEFPDDVSIVLMRAVSSHSKLVDNLLAPLRLLAPVRDRTSLS